MQRYGMGRLTAYVHKQPATVLWSRDLFLTDCLWLQEGPVMISSADPDGHWTPCVWPFEPAEYSEESRRFKGPSHVRVTAWHDGKYTRSLSLRCCLCFVDIF